MSVVRVEHVSKEYQLGKQTVLALDDISMVVAPGRFLAIAGPSGSGKTTLLNMIGCIDTPTRGSIFIGDEMVSGKTPDELAELRSSTLGFVFQTFNLLPVLSAWENVEYPMLQRSDISRANRRARVDHYMNVVGLSAKAKHRPNELSGGQRQRVAIARALAGGPSIVLADEPTANLDSKTGESILVLMKQINETEKTTFIFSTHDFRVMELADRVVSVADGRLVV
ncbi:MAG: ABC transporter ATP-binding protein [Gammaproteobacteria bacterium]